MSDDSGSGWSRRQMIAAGTTGLIAATATGQSSTGHTRAAARGRQEAADGTPEQVHLTWDGDPARTVVVSWASPGQAIRPRVRIGQRVIPATERSYTDPISGTITWTYHARVDELRPGATYGYAVTADNDGNAPDPFSATFTTAPEARAAFRFTSFGDLAAPPTSVPWSRRTPDTPGSPSGAPREARGALPPGDDWQAAYAVGAVETFQPLFHLLNGDIAGLTRGVVTPAAWRQFGNNVQASAANRPWLPVPGSHGLELGNGEQAVSSFLARYTLPPNGVNGLEGRWYAFRVGTALFVCLSGDDVAYVGPAANAAAPTPRLPAPPTAINSRYSRGYSGGAQTRWLESTLAAARADSSIDWIIVQLHQCACSSAPDGDGSDLGVRREWLPLFDTYEVDLVLSGHDHGYERSFPVRGVDAWAGVDTLTGAATDTRRPHPVTTVDSGVFDTSQGTVHLTLGCGVSVPPPGGSGLVSPARGRTARVITRPSEPAQDPRANAVEAATWSARRAPSTGYGIAVFDVNPGNEADGQTSITVRYYHTADAEQVSPAAGAPGARSDDYTLSDTFTLLRPRSDRRRWHPKA